MISDSLINGIFIWLAALSVGIVMLFAVVIPAMLDDYRKKRPTRPGGSGMSENKLSDVWCPFCREGGFDLEGLKIHLEHYCDEYEKLDGRTALQRDIGNRPQRQEDWDE